MYRTVKGVPVALKSLSSDMRVVWIPHMDVQVERLDTGDSKRFWIDVYFVDKVSVIARRAALIRRVERNIREVEVTPGSVVLEPSVRSPNRLYDLLYEAYTYSAETLRTKNLERATRLSRWSQLKNLLIPAGYTRHLRRDDADATLVRESIWAYEILKDALLIKDVSAPRRSIVRSEGVYWYPIVLKRRREGLPLALDGTDKSLRVEVRYTRLLEVDEGARSAFMEKVGGSPFGV